MSKAWGGLGGAGAWALDAERAEEEERENAAAGGFPAPEPPAAAGGAASFPSLREAAAGGGGKSKKKKGTTLSLSEFTTYGAASGRRPAAAEPKGLTPQEMMMLPTGPRERSAEELDRSRLGGGFRSYGGGERRGGGGFDDDGRRGGPGRDADLDAPSRADESGNWSLNKKSFSPSPVDSGARNRYGSLGGGAAASPFGRADDDGDWSRGKKPMPSRYPSLGSGGAGGFRDSPTSTDSDRWSRAAPPHNGERERPRLVLDPPKRDASASPTPPPAEAVARIRPSPFGAARPREDVLAEKGLDWRKMETEIGHKTSRPTSSQSSRPGSAHSSRPGSPGSQASAVGSEGPPRARPKVNPFGDAKPREVVLQEKGKDWRKIDLELEHRQIDRQETDEEKLLKEEINLLRVDLKETEANISDEDKKGLSEKLSQMERELECLTVELDNKVRFGQRPGSGSGKVTAQLPTNSAEESQIAESTEQICSGSSIDQNPKQVEERWGFQGNRDRGSFGGNRNADRFVCSYFP
ncbi:hypothetical protein E2562_036506 [Oryza meyeriana var. granulata]|uniref:Uncharacterized protein n=1 Tax=Oryza meyeriana var. granulata TaxID=110450 RepID=A0A6G1FGD7_9ORYZ|nr:hypothetical protein E2562_036506 [Oryza meyeriana var. granulata]